MQNDDDTGNGVLAVEPTAAPVTAASSTPYRAARRARRNTGSELTAAERLEILQQAAFDLHAYGIKVQALNHPERQMAILAFTGVAYCQYCRHLRLQQEMQGEKCQYCTV